MTPSVATLLLVCSWLATLLLHQRFLALLLFYLRDPQRASAYVEMVYHSKNVYYGNIALWTLFILAIQSFASVAVFVEHQWFIGVFYLVFLVDLVLFFRIGAEELSRIHFTDRAHWLLAPEIVFPRSEQQAFFQPSLYLLIGLVAVYLVGSILSTG